MKFTTPFSMLAAVVLALGVTSANAAIVYVGATAGASGNTTGLISGDHSDWKEAGANDDGSGNVRLDDTLWGAIGDQGFGATSLGLPGVWEASLAGNAPEIRTSIAGLAPGQYDVYLLYSTASSVLTWTTEAGLNGGSQSSYNGSVGTVVATNGVFQARQVLLGSISGNSFTVEVDDVPASGDNRARYIGVGYEFTGAAVPAPAALPAGLALIGIVAARRRNLA